MNSGRASRIRAFTMIEMVVVLMIMVLLATMVVPSLSNLFKRSKVQQTAKVVVAAIYKARAEAQRYRSNVGIFFGDDPNRHQGRWAPPLSTTLPARPNYIEIWTVATGNTPYDMWLRDNGNYNWYQDTFNSGQIHPLDPSTNTANGASEFPYFVKGVLLTTQPFTFPEGVRVIAGHYYDDTYGTREFSWPVYWNDSVGEIKRHNAVMTRNGSVPTYNYDHCYRALLIYDVANGDHLVVEVGEWKATSRPRIIDGSINKLNGTVLTSPSQIDQLIN
jgi:prepilin-type N-terminal cleavage/methylation domain-containing protein